MSTAALSTLSTYVGVEIVDVTPMLAVKWLERNTHNQPLREGRIAEYAREMSEGRWRFNAEPVQFGDNGVLLNGQHRLWAIVKSGTTQRMLVVRGLDPDVQLSMDQGTRRTPAGQLHIAGIEVSSTVAASIRVLIRWREGRLFGDMIAVKPTTSEIVAWAQSRPSDVARLRELSTSGLGQIPVAPSLALAIAFGFDAIDSEDAETFLTGLRTGAGLKAGSPVLALRNRLFRTRETKTRLSDRDMIGLFVVAWNAYRENRTLARLQRPTGAGWKIDTFPEPR